MDPESHGAKRTAGPTRAPVARTAMLIRRPVAEVFEAFVEPSITTRFWFSKSSGRLEAGKLVTWHWEMYGVSAPVRVQAIDPNRRILIEWPGENGPTTVELLFITRDEESTFVVVTEDGFAGDAEELVRQAMDSTQGFTLALAGAKAWLEHGIELGLVRDRFPDGIDGQPS